MKTIKARIGDEILPIRIRICFRTVPSLCGQSRAMNIGISYDRGVLKIVNHVKSKLRRVWNTKTAKKYSESMIKLSIALICLSFSAPDQIWRATYRSRMLDNTVDRRLPSSKNRTLWTQGRIIGNVVSVRAAIKSDLGIFSPATKITNCCTWGYVGAGENKTACSAAELGHERRRRKRKRLNWTSSATKFSGRRLYAVLYRRLMTEVQGN
ncbi:uncharacterized protein PHALS_07295 [Plasmopara halstedii]|uniref:Uncharacterized protein n=1 Tax=Plasmopara halstedii TaxID=4781 RepID=A0A0P1B5Q0_PLAHL|nr:uncharacterized protein PHALS_07295 [Plasmopara halstedii]CEG49537.1 hypothetical protein PHALS_07295 [Plasmopara halstedii]|eukprot:XP_024585906.1 hypothetical protein PHALS_07295 [Plasmopara halstedii]